MRAPKVMGAAGATLLLLGSLACEHSDWSEATPVDAQAGSSVDVPQRSAPKPVAAPTPRTAREAYEHALMQSGLASTKQGRSWLRLHDGWLQDPLSVALPLRERLALDATHPDAVAYAFEMREGQRLELSLMPAEEQQLRVPPSFLDLWRLVDEAEPRLVRSTQSSTLNHEAERDGRFVLVVQPPLHAGGIVDVELQAHASLTFPVQGKGRSAVQSFFGAPRDRGRREHHGIDIFAARGTHALAGSKSRVVRVGTNKRGGNVVWLRDFERSLVMYYAHLNKPLVEVGQWLAAGEAVGEIGNSGNARGGKPHLHFGIYRRGPVDPLPFVHVRSRPVVAPQVEPETLGSRHVVSIRKARLRAEPIGRASVLAELPQGTQVVPVAIRGRSLRVRLEDGRHGWLPPRALRRMSPPDEESLPVPSTPVHPS